MKRIEVPGFLVLVALPAILVAAQPAGPAGPPPGVDHPYATPSFPDVPPAELRAIASASGELPPLPQWCEGTCVIDIAFFYDPEAIGQTLGSAFPGVGDPDEPWGPQTVGELRADVLKSIVAANALFRRARLDAELRLVGLERDPALTGLQFPEALEHVRSERLARARSRYGADLGYAITVDSTPRRCTAEARTAGMSHETARSFAVGVLRTGCLGHLTLITLVGYNLGLLLEAGHVGNQGHAPYLPFGYGYVGKNRFGERYGSLMASNGFIPYFSTVEPVYGRVLGDADGSDAARALRYTIPDAARYSRTVVPERVEDPHGYDCRPSASRACLNERRFGVSARYSTQSVARAPAKRLDAYGFGDSGALFYFFGPDNPEMLLKVVDGCWLNDHWWVFGSAATDLTYEVAIEDLADGGRTVEYLHNGGGVVVGDNGYSTAAGVINDTSAFPCRRAAAQAGKRRQSAGGPAVHIAPGYDQRAVAGLVAARDASVALDYGCIGESCLNNWRFRVGVSVSANLETREACDNCNSGTGVVPTYGLGDSGVLSYFFEPDNPEVLLKVLDGCAVNGYWWVFGSAATDLRYEAYVYDYSSTYRHSRGHLIREYNRYDHHGSGWITGSNGYSTRTGVINDTSAFPCNE